MSEQFNDKHLLWWVIKAIAHHPLDVSFADLKDDELWIDIEAPDWVMPAIFEKIKIMEDEGGLD